MEEEKNDAVVEELEETTPEEELTPETDWEAEAKKARGIAQRALTKLKKLGEKPKEKEEKQPEPVKKTQTPDGLDETQLDYLDVKGITDQDEIDVIQQVVQKTGMTVRQALKDEYVVSKLESLRAEKAVKDATPSSTKRTGAGNVNDVATAIAAFERTGELPSDFELRSKVVNALDARNNATLPPWRR